MGREKKREAGCFYVLTEAPRNQERKGRTQCGVLRRRKAIGFSLYLSVSLVSVIMYYFFH